MFELLFLGTAASVPSAERGLPALIVSSGERRVLVDCGEGTQRQILRSGAGFRRLERVLLTHAHLDHVLGLAGLVATLALYRAADRLLVQGAPRTVEYARRYLLQGVWGRRTPIAIKFEALRPGRVAEEGGFAIDCFPVRHGDSDSLGFSFEQRRDRPLDPARLDQLGVPAGPLRGMLARGETVRLPDGRRVSPEEVQGPPARAAKLVVVGDAEETESLVPHVSGADALVIEATFLAADAERAATRGHLTAAQAAGLARDAGVGTLYLTHISGRYPREEVLAEARRIFPATHIADDFARVAVRAGSTTP
jgi:ribonuclease Z